MTRTSITVLARAKINLHLDVIGRLPNGYHAIETLFQSIHLADTLVCTKRDAGVAIECDQPDVPIGADNLITKASDLFFRFAGIDGGLHVSLCKSIPMGGGLGGSSADAAAALLALNRLYGTHFPLDTLECLGAKVGADVPFCVRGGTAWGRGTGTSLRSYAPMEGHPVLLANPGVHVDTAAAYRALAVTEPARPSGQMGLTGLERGDMILRGWMNALSDAALTDYALQGTRNCFEPVVFAAHPEIEAIRNALRAQRAFAMMSGSGATVFGVFSDLRHAIEAEQALRGQCRFLVLTRFARHGVLCQCSQGDDAR